MFRSVTITGSLYLALAKVQLLKMFGKNKSLWTCSGVAAYCVKSIMMYMLCAVWQHSMSSP